MANLPADLPTNWTQGQIISPNGTEVGLSEQYGYNYLNEQVNNTQTEVNSLGTAQTNTQQQVSTLSTQVGNIQGQVTTQGQSITALQETTTSQGQSITSLQGQVSSNDTDIAGLQQTTTTQGQSITTLQGQVSTLNQTTTTQGENISTLQSEVSAINTALDSAAQESSVQDIIDSIGSATDTGGSSTAGTLMAKMNNMLSNAGAVKSVQRGIVSKQSRGTASVTVTINSVNTQKSILILGNASWYEDSSYTTQLSWVGTFSSNTTLTMYGPQGGGSDVSNTYSTYWQVVEFY